MLFLLFEMGLELSIDKLRVRRARGERAAGLPAAQRTGAHHHVMIAGLSAGMVVMSVSLVLLA